MDCHFEFRPTVKVFGIGTWVHKFCFNFVFAKTQEIKSKLPSQRVFKFS